MEQLLRQLVDKLRAAHGEDLVSVVLYGSAADSSQHDPEFSDINILCVLREVAPPQLARSQPIFNWWLMFRNPAPLLLSEKELLRSADCFPIEFRDMQRRRRVLAGRDLIETLAVENTFYRAQVEYELRSKLLRLRQKAAAHLADSKLLGRLLLDSVTTFCLLIRHALFLYGVDAPLDRRAVLKLAQERFAIDPASFLRLLDAREKKIKSATLQTGPLLADYLKQIAIIIDAVDGLETTAAAGAKGNV